MELLQKLKNELQENETRVGFYKRIISNHEEEIEEYQNKIEGLEKENEITRKKISKIELSKSMDIRKENGKDCGSSVS